MKSLAAVIATLTLAAPAFAGGPVTVASEPTVTPTYAPAAPASVDWSGLYVGAQLGYADVDSNDGGLDGYGFLGGVHAGYRWDFGQYVAGAELDYDTASIDLGGDTGTLDDVARLKLMGGAEFGNSLIYATTGIARASATVGGDSLRDNGYFLGAGIDYALTDRWSVGGELMQHRFKDFDGSTVDLDATTLKAKVSLRF
ncbi:outer membrane beta-barrel protein [Tabrizicola sp.]|uniref:outer membrane protein n=1 Tax=Tabrizicola sp. TaxID=2005166 RepID=UPI002606EB53|nr:outer membrane beta-barrel protein [Tabrizicola sp.]MDM7930969.1 outer membrane beta-barrel protein [Tabrizicola sp.]